MYVCVQNCVLQRKRVYHVGANSLLLHPTSVAMIPSVSGQAVTRVTVNTIYTRSTVTTWVINTVIDVCKYLSD